jgi:hypothetical protein
MKLLRDKYQSRFIVYDNEAYNLPLDVIYYIESSWNYKLNNYVYSHQEDIAKLLRTKLADVFPYRLEIVSRKQFQNPIIQERIQHWHPEAPNIQFSNLVLPNAKEKDLKYQQEVTSRLENPNREFETSFICRVAPNKDEDTFGFYAIDVSLCSEVLVTTILHDYVADLTQYNIKAVNGGVDYVQAIEEKHLSPRFAPNKATNQEKSQGFDWKGVVTKIITASVSSLVFSAGALFQSVPSFLGHLSENNVNDIDPQTAQRIQDIQRILAAHQEQYGVNAFLEELGSKVIAELQKPVTKQISSLVIDAKNNYNPLLLEYNKKIELDPVKKTIYIFFLQHLEGIRLKDRPAYYQEFRQIYLNVVKTGEMNNIDKTLDAIVNLESNRFNEELSRINKEINKELAPKMADMYRIKGKRGDLYRIHLDKSKIHLPAVLKI